MQPVEAQVFDLIEPVVSALGFELVGVEYWPQGRQPLLRIYIDSANGISVDDCGRVSHQVSGVLDVEDPVQGRYTLEVSSPGLDRPLFTEAHYRRFIGSKVKIRLAAPKDGQRNFVGILRDVLDDSIVIEVDEKEHTLPMAAIYKAHLVSEL